MSRCWVLAAVVAIAAMAGCAPLVPGSNGQDGHASPLPSRPREIRIDGLDPCGVLNPAQLTELDIGGPRFTPPGEEDGATCQWRHSPDEPLEGFLVQILIGLSAETALEAIPNASATSVAGFPAVQAPPQYGSPDLSCVIFVGVAPEQNLYIQYNYRGTQVPMTRDLACQKAHTAAELAMQTLIAQTGGG